MSFHYEFVSVLMIAQPNGRSLLVMVDSKRLLSVSYILGYLNTAFLATKSGGTSQATDPIIFDLTPVNYGENYDSATGIYTVSMDGLYEFNIQIYCSLNGDQCVYYISVDGTLTTDTPSALAGTANDVVGVATSVILELSEGQQVWISPGHWEYDIY